MSFQQRDVSSKATNIILQSWLTGTQKQYAPYIKKWHEFCSKWEVNSYNPPLNTALDFLVSLHEQGLSYTAVNTARSALSAIILPTDNVNIGSHPIVSRFMKGIFKSNPPVPRYHTTWDVNTGLPFLFVIAAKANSIQSEIVDSEISDANCTCFSTKRAKSPHARHLVHERRGQLFWVCSPRAHKTKPTGI